MKFHEYTRSVLHAKSVVIDEHLSVVGSSNFDYLSILWNWELAVVIDDVAIVEELRKQYAEDLKERETVNDQSAGKRHWWRRVFTWIGAAGIRKI